MKLNNLMESKMPDTTNDPYTSSEWAIPEGQRNATMSHLAGKLIIRFGDTDEARNKFNEMATRCEPVLPDSELDSIWRSAQKFGRKVCSSEGYIPPEKYNGSLLFKPSDFSDTAQAEAFASIYNDRLAYTKGTGFLVYDGVVWEETKTKPREVYHEFSALQLREASIELADAKKRMEECGAWDMLETMSTKKALSEFNREQREAYYTHQLAKNYHTFALEERNTRNISAALKEIEPIVEVDVSVLDADPYLLNTPTCTINLAKGIDGVMEHNPSDMLTRCTAVSPGMDGKAIWEDALHTFFGDDSDLIEYVQKIAGLALIGNVYVEALIIAYGAGKNGKSTFWNSMLRVLGTYGGSISAEALTVGCKTNIKAELAEIRGKRLLVAAELEEGARLSTAAVKKFCSTDEIMGEKKFFQPQTFRPTHQLLLYTNHLPKVGGNDFGTWRRLIVVPFLKTISESSDIKNYTDYLVEHAGPYILTWMIEGAQKVIADEFHIEQPEVVKEATEDYREKSDWLDEFLTECCEVGPEFTAPSGEFYQEYRSYCSRTGDYTRNSADFYSAIAHAGFERTRTKKGRFVKGVRIKMGF